MIRHLEQLHQLKLTAIAKLKIHPDDASTRARAVALTEACELVNAHLEVESLRDEGHSR